MNRGEVLMIWLAQSKYSTVLPSATVASSMGLPQKIFACDGVCVVLNVGMIIKLQIEQHLQTARATN